MNWLFTNFCIICFGEKLKFIVNFSFNLIFIKNARKPQAFKLGEEWLPGAKRRQIIFIA